jgi:hypothetical protein
MTQLMARLARDDAGSLDVVMKRFGISVKPEIPWGANRTGDWTVKVVLTGYRQPSS